jgi:Lon protease-like protein
VYECGTVGTIEQAVPLEDGRYNIVVRGDIRFRILEEVSRVPYRTARVIAEPDLTPGPSTEAYAQREWLADVSRQYLRYLPDQSSVPEIETVSLDALTNALIMSLNLDMEEKQKLLETRRPRARRADRQRAHQPHGKPALSSAAAAIPRT